ncbi:MAG: triose-phosphate isomerase [Bacteroidetes bacterium]|jgi:triosephosphate isomerase|nr:MAG: triose-phosphate isomerase [Bacteroidota bacterium]
MRPKIVAANWKLNKTLEEGLQLVNFLLSKTNPYDEVIKIICPTFPLLYPLSKVLDASKKFYLGAQNCSAYEKGAYTGEVSAEILRSVGCEYVIIGHSERRKIFGETEEILKQKLNTALKNGLKVIYCVGEELEQRKEGVHFNVVKAQLENILQLEDNQLQSIIIAYEPVWAIGTGVNATPRQAQEMHAFIREVISTKNIELASVMPILYGGSCNATNASQIFSQKDIDGGLIGSASLKGEEFIQIIYAAS